MLMVIMVMLMMMRLLLARVSQFDKKCFWVCLVCAMEYLELIVLGDANSLICPAGQNRWVASASPARWAPARKECC